MPGARDVLNRVRRRLWRQFGLVRAMKALILLVFAVVGVAFYNARTTAIGHWMRADGWHAGIVVLAYILLLFIFGLYDAEKDLANLEKVTFALVPRQPELHSSVSFNYPTGRLTVADLLIVRLTATVRNTESMPVKVEFICIELLTRTSGWRRWKATRVEYEKQLHDPMGGIGGLKWRPWEPHDIPSKHKREITLDFPVRDGSKYRTGQLIVKVTMDVVGQSILTQKVPISFPSPPPAAPPETTAS